MITVAFSTHRLECLPAAFALMRKHDVVVLEEPSIPEFEDMLQGTMSPEEFSFELGSEFPELTRQQCEQLRTLAREGRRVYQIEPYLECLLAIHEALSEGKSASDFPPGSMEQQVYLSERTAGKALMDYYETVVSAPFGKVVEAVQIFARADAARLRLRDGLRARAIASFQRSADSIYVEAGYIHYGLLVELRRRLPKGISAKPKFLLADAAGVMLGKRQALGPGDLLTLLYVFHPSLDRPFLDVLAARSLIYVKLLQKEELLADGADPHPHLRDEIRCIRAVEQLSYEDCRTVFDAIRLRSRGKARELVESYVSGR